MAIMIDMDMPKNCDECDFWSNVIGGYGADYDCELTGNQFNEINTKPDWCPLKEIEELPSAEPERKKGKWITKKDNPNCCSECGACWDNDYVESRELYYTGKIPNYCPECGADMRGETNAAD